MRRGFGSVLVLPAIAFIACGGGSGGSGGSSIPIDQLGSEFAAVFCHKMFMCCDASERTSIDSTAVDEATCRSSMSADAKFALLQAEVAGGHVTYRGDHARSCIDAVAALPCAQWGADFELLRFPACQTIVEGTIATGGVCASNDECVSGFCGSSTGALVCAPPAQLGESCDFARCVSGLACRTDASASPAKCGQPLPDGAACVDRNDCVSGYCITDGTGQAFCGLFPVCKGI
jgi:hypothetical protein